mmetsp:Transcript_19678/g.45368  ORF Transcript_19678/g.45368 Transcript_19678/m.45368 type:complete len:104 (+) Transcript_19678:190-501(+)
MPGEDHEDRGQMHPRLVQDVELVVRALARVHELQHGLQEVAGDAQVLEAGEQPQERGDQGRLPVAVAVLLHLAAVPVRRHGCARYLRPAPGAFGGAGRSCKMP